MTVWCQHYPPTPNVRTRAVNVDTTTTMVTPISPATVTCDLGRARRRPLPTTHHTARAIDTARRTAMHANTVRAHLPGSRYIRVSFRAIWHLKVLWRSRSLLGHRYGCCTAHVNVLFVYHRWFHRRITLPGRASSFGPSLVTLLSKFPVTWRLV